MMMFFFLLLKGGGDDDDGILMNGILKTIHQIHLIEV